MFGDYFQTWWTQFAFFLVVGGATKRLVALHDLPGGLRPGRPGGSGAPRLARSVSAHPEGAAAGGATLVVRELPQTAETRPGNPDADTSSPR